jgi:hypothetical protein
VLLSKLQMGRRFVEPAVLEILCRTDQSKIGVVRAQSTWECLQERLHRSGMPVERQTERIIEEQPGCIRPIAR